MAIVIAILPQVLVPARDRVGPVALIPVIESAAFLVMLIIAAKPGPVPRRFRPIILFLFSLLIAANAVAAARLVVLVLDGGKVDGVALTANRLLIAGSLVLLANVITFGLLYWQLDGGGPAGRASDTVPPVSSSADRDGRGWPPRAGDRDSLTTSNGVHQRRRLQPDRHHATHHRARRSLACMRSLAVIVVVVSE